MSDYPRPPYHYGPTNQEAQAMHQPKRYVLRLKRFDKPAGTIVYEFSGATYGCVSDDERASGLEHTAVTLRPDGRFPFFTVPVRDLDLFPATSKAPESQTEVDVQTVAADTKQLLLDAGLRFEQIGIGKPAVSSEYAAGFEAGRAESAEEIALGDKRIASLTKLLQTIPACPRHGDQCIPHAIEWVKTAIEALQSADRLMQQLKALSTPIDVDKATLPKVPTEPNWRGEPS